MRSLLQQFPGDFGVDGLNRHGAEAGRQAGQRVSMLVGKICSGYLAAAGDATIMKSWTGVVW